MIKIEDYILLPLSERKNHLQLDEPCVDRGGPRGGGLSSNCKGLLAHILDTTIPLGHKIHLCHACNNSSCSNPKHMYWGTALENRLDEVANGGRSVWQRMVDKYGLEAAIEMQRNKSRKK